MKPAQCLMGVLMQVEKDQVTMAAADGSRLSVRKGQLAHAVKDTINIIIPSRALNELARAAHDPEEPIYMAVPKQRGQVIFRVKDVEVVSQLIDGTVPDYHQIIPRNSAVNAARRLPPTARTALYENGWHWLLRDLQREVVYTDILAFIEDADAPLPSGAPPLLPVVQAIR